MKQNQNFGVAVLVIALACLVACTARTSKIAMNTVEFTVDTLIHPQAPVLTIIYEKEDFSEGRFSVENSSDAPMKWVYSWPDSLYERAKTMSLRHPSSSDTVSYSIYYKLPENTESKIAQKQFLLSPGSSKISLKYRSQSTTPRGWTEGMTAYISTTMYDTYYLVDSAGDPEFMAALEGTWDFGQFLFVEEYEPGLEQYAAMAAKYPDSRYLMASLSSGVNYESFRSKEDIHKVYDNFSEENRTGYWSSKIERYLGKTRFENLELPAWDTREPEPIITDRSKYTLVIFSASWCAPCHALIPLLKEIYDDIGDRMDFVYVSVDDTVYPSKDGDKDGIGMWGDIMRKYEIPWRSVMALDKMDYMQNTYFFGGIPAQFLVAPDLTMEKIEIRNTEGKDKLYSVID